MSKRRDLPRARVVITGASRGIGRAIAVELAHLRGRLLVNARDEERLAELARELGGWGATVEQVAGDVTDPDVRQRIVAAAQTHFGGLDILINNAGVGAIGPFADASPDRLRRIMEVNFFAPVELIRAALPVLRQGDSALIVNVGSVLGHRGVPWKSEYCASKFALHGFSDALRAELATAGIDVLLVSPSTTASEFFDNLLEGTAGGDTPPRGMAPEVVARFVVRQMRSARHELILSPGGRLLVWLDRLCPPLANQVVAWFTPRPPRPNS